MKTRQGGLRTDLLPRCSHTNCKQWSPMYGIERVGPLLSCGWGPWSPAQALRPLQHHPSWESCPRFLQGKWPRSHARCVIRDGAQAS